WGSPFIRSLSYDDNLPQPPWFVEAIRAAESAFRFQRGRGATPGARFAPAHARSGVDQPVADTSSAVRMRRPLCSRVSVFRMASTAGRQPPQPVPAPQASPMELQHLAPAPMAARIARSVTLLQWQTSM